MIGLVGKKVGMTRIFTEDGVSIPVTVIEVEANLTGERASYREEVESTLRQSTSGPQQLVGPLIAIPVSEIFYTSEDDKKIEHKRSYLHFLLPESLVIDGNQQVFLTIFSSGEIGKAPLLFSVLTDFTLVR
jgi:inner membrane protein involved in colicin E2 resistance